MYDITSTYLENASQVAHLGRAGQLSTVARKTQRQPAEPGTLVASTVGERCIEAAFRVGLRKAHLAELVGVSWQAVHSWTRGTTPSLDNVRRVASVTGYTAEEILGWAAGNDPPFEAWQQFKETDEYKSITDEERRTLAAVMWPSHKEPTLSSYLFMLQGLRSAADKTSVRATKRL